MAKYILSFLLLTLVSFGANAQIVIDNPTTGGVVRDHNMTYATSSWITGSTFSTWTTYTWFTTTTTNTYVQDCIVGNYSNWYSWSTAQGIVEFDLAGLPTTDMTTDNFTARLNSLNASSVLGYSSSMDVGLYDLADAREDNAITTGDYGQYTTLIHSETFVPPSTMPDFDDVDVTTALRNDLFGGGLAGDSSGFLLRATSGWNTQIEYDGTSPTLVITVTPIVEDAGTDAGTDAGADAGTDADTDTDTDSDTDTDTDSDSDSDSDTDSDTDTDTDTDTDSDSSGDDGCGCSSPGIQTSHSLFGAILSLFV